jgi:diguanylate cyclase (GGDEF)-like protein
LHREHFGDVQSDGAGISEPALADQLRSTLLGAQAVAFDWSLSEGRICWDAAQPSVLAGAESTSSDHFGPFRTLLDRESLRRLSSLVDEPFPANPAFNLEFVDGAGTTRRWFEISALRMPGTDGRADRLKGVIRNTGNGRTTDENASWLADRDDLTGHLNRARLREALSQVIGRAGSVGELHAYLVAAIDQLGVVNQIHGYDAADEVIAAVAQRLGQALRTADLIGRTAGNKFGIVLKLRSEAELARIAARLHEAVNGKTIETSRGAVSATISIGAVLAPQHAANSTEAMGRAEEALERARSFGRNGFAVYAPSLHRESARRRLAAAGDEIVSALEQDRILFAYQPIIAAKLRTPALYECLLRIQRKDGTLLAAKDFIPAAEALGLVRMLDRRALELAVGKLYRNKAIKLAINVSATTAGDRAWLISFINYVREHRNVASRLTVELTETAALNLFEENARFITRLRDIGCRVAIDDFGAGHTSFRTLHQLRVDAVKIDGMYVEHLAQYPENQLLVRTLAELARNLRLETVAEWVTSEEDAAILESYGIDFFQGHYFGRPEVCPPWSQAKQVTAAA